MVSVKKWERFTKQEIEQFVKESTSYAQLGRKVGYDNVGKSGSANLAIHNMIEELQLDVSHFKGQGWNKDNFDYSRFRYGNNIKASTAVKALIALRGHKCERCGNTEWLGEPIPLQVHHIDGDGLNSTLDNLQLLCPNCHALTDNFCGKNQKNHGKTYIKEEDFVKALQENPNIRQALLSIGLTPKGRNYYRAYELIQKYNIEKFLEKYE